MIFLRFGNLHVAKRHAAHGEAMCFARGVREHAPPRNFFKMVQFGVYLDQISTLKNFEKYHFLYNFFFKLPFLMYKNIKNYHFLYKK